MALLMGLMILELSRTDLFNKIFLFRDMGSKKILLSRIMDINAKNKIDVLIPSLDSELQSCIEIQDILKNIGISTSITLFKIF